MAVTLTYGAGRGHALIGRALYLPEGCAADEEHRELAGVPEEMMFATKPQLAPRPPSPPTLERLCRDNSMIESQRTAAAVTGS